MLIVVTLAEKVYFMKYVLFINLFLFVVHSNFKTQNSDMGSVFENAEVLKITEALIRFRVVKLSGSVFIDFSRGHAFTDMPVIQLDFDKLVFGRMKFNGEIRSLKTIKKEIGGNQPIDFWMILYKTEITLGKHVFENYEVLGRFHYKELGNLSFVGFTSVQETTWIVENGTAFYVPYHYLFILNHSCGQCSHL